MLAKVSTVGKRSVVCQKRPCWWCGRRDPRVRCGMTVMAMAVSVGEICESTRLAREMALTGNYEQAGVYYQGVVQMLHRLLLTISDHTRRSKWQLVSLDLDSLR